MYWVYGGTIHQLNEVGFTVSKAIQYNERGFKKSVRETYRLTGMLFADSQAELTTALAARQAVYNQSAQSFGLLLDDQTTRTVHYVDTNDTIGGTRVVDFGYPDSKGAEYSTYRTWTATLEADYPYYDNDLLQFTESVAFAGGGQKFVMIQTLEGLPQKQQVAQSVPYMATQTGSAIGYQSYPTPPAPLWPGDEHYDQRRVDYKGPKNTGGIFTEYQVSWQYTFESAVPLFGGGLPTEL